ncbi:ABC transporter substrate-binding protein [Cobetia crustatorum]|uniref:ABC transporter substrate-binding protein n=1 Tax=Cobetia crustatorum TaxID=553385 RepID=A0A558HJK2_9GAMM|nr:ABC transporter substrate-binding protein [Cobetia crustatorum]TVU69300.1 ABC transporter substrate-binding protein [Cobetia crustatorum]
MLVTRGRCARSRTWRSSLLLPVLLLSSLLLTQVASAADTYPGFDPQSDEHQTLWLRNGQPLKRLDTTADSMRDGTATDANMSHRADLEIHAALDLPEIRPLLVRYSRKHPDLLMHYVNRSALSLEATYLKAPLKTRADLMISSAMGLQYRLANQGHARALDTPNLLAWPDNSRWRNELYAMSFEPIVMVARRDAMQRLADLDGLRNPRDVLRSHRDLWHLLETRRDVLRGRIITYDPRASGSGFTYAVSDARQSPRYWTLVRAMGQADARLVNTTGAMLEALAEGKVDIAYNLVGPYAVTFARTHPELEVIVPEDYVLIQRRLAFVPRQAPHPEAGEAFLDWWLSSEGQQRVANESELGALHPEVRGEGSAHDLRERLGDALRPIDIGPGLLATLDRLKQASFLSRWTLEFQAPPPVIQEK